MLQSAKNAFTSFKVGLGNFLFPTSAAAKTVKPSKNLASVRSASKDSHARSISSKKDDKENITNSFQDLSIREPAAVEASVKSKGP